MASGLRARPSKFNLPELLELEIELELPANGPHGARLGRFQLEVGPSQPLYLIRATWQSGIRRRPGPHFSTRLAADSGSLGVSQWPWHDAKKLAADKPWPGDSYPGTCPSMCSTGPRPGRTGRALAVAG